MNRLDWTILGLKLLAIYIALQGFELISTQFSTLFLIVSTTSETMTGLQMSDFLMFILLGLLLPVTLSILVWVKASAIANRIWVSSHQEFVASPIGMQAWEVRKILFSAVGLYILLAKLPDVLRMSVMYFQVLTANFPRNGLYGSAEPIAFFIGVFLQLMVGLRLLFMPYDEENEMYDDEYNEEE